VKIVRLQAENVKRLKAVEVAPTGELVVVGGKNDAGKSSLLDAIEMAMGGEAATPPQPVRRGEKAAKVVLDLGDLVVTRTFTAAGGRKLVVENKEGARFKSPQAMLDRLYGELAFDPLAFERLDPKPQADVLRRLVGLDMTALDGRRADLYEQRTEANREVKALQVTVDSVTPWADAPAQEVSIEALANQLAEAEKLQQIAVQRGVVVRDARSSREAAALRRQGVVNEMAAIEKRLADLRVALGEADEDLSQRDAGIQVAEVAVADALAAVPDTAALRDQLALAERTNGKVRQNAQHAEVVRMLEAAKAVADGLDARIAGIDAEREAMLAAAEFPVPGLGIGPDGVTLDGLPFEQASTSDRLRVSVAIGLASKPELKVLLVRDGSLLGEGKLQLLAEMAKAAGAQVWLEMLQEAPDGRTTVFIEDGSVQGPQA
jgi:DNA repair exonuclease SbcCD ATPase subunit